jgi:hypothetical protein
LRSGGRERVLRGEEDGNLLHARKTTP